MEAHGSPLIGPIETHFIIWITYVKRAQLILNLHEIAPVHDSHVIDYLGLEGRGSRILGCSLKKMQIS